MRRASGLGWLLAVVVFAGPAGAQWATIPDSMFLPITLPSTISFGYPPNAIYLPHIHDLARRRQFDSLDAMFNELEADVASDVRNEIRFSDAFEAFARDEPALLESIDAWVRSRPRSPHAYVARASYHVATAWRRRGKAYVRDTPPENIRGMETFAKKAVDDLQAALLRDSTHLVAYETLIGVLQLFGAHDLASQILVRGTSLHRGSSILYRSFVHMLWPRWGGSEDSMIDFAERVARDVADNPRLETLRGAVHESRAYDSTLANNLAGAVRELNKALAFGPERTYLLARGKAYYGLGAYEYAFHDLRAAMIERSQDSETLDYYGRTLVELATRARPEIRGAVLDRAIETLTLASYLEPSNTAVTTALAKAKGMARK